MSKIVESLRSDLGVLQDVGAISKVTMREFDAICPPTVRKWEQGDTRPAGPALKLLNIIADKGLQVIL